MADERNPAPAPDSSTGFTAPSSLTPPAANVNRDAADFNGQDRAKSDHAAAYAKTGHSHLPEFVMLGRWILGLLLVFVCGWGLLALAFYLTRTRVSRPEIAFAVFAALDLVLFFFLERNFWLSHFMGLRIEPGSHSWQSAIMLWLLGVPGLLFRSTNFHGEAVAEARGATLTRTRPQHAQRSDSVREVVETIVFVVVLVLLLKSFAAEAFVIPTGSMAQTLLGYQKEIVCPDCGIKFPINCSQEVDPPDGGKPTPVYACVCPNCRQRIHFPSAPPSYVQNFLNTSREIEDPGPNSGDRVLVAKFVYDLLGKPPDRLDVVVFKYPGDDKFPATGPHKNHVPMNYIKRLIGLPGETIAIRGGKLYHLPESKWLHYDDYEKAKRDPDLMATLWQKDHMHINDEEAVKLFNKREFQIIRKSPENILSMMRLVYDNDHPSREKGVPQRWRATNDGPWAPHQPHGFRLEGGDPDRTYWLGYQHLLRDTPDKPALIMDIMGYNTYQGGMHRDPLLGKNWVPDLILECEATIDNPQGELTLELSYGVERFRARWDLASGSCTLLRVFEEGGKEVEQKMGDSKPTAMNRKGTYRLRFANVDQRLCVWVDGELPFDSGYTYEVSRPVRPTEKNDLKQPASIGVKGGGVAVHKLKLFRDTYYTVGSGGAPSEPDVPGLEETNPSSFDDYKPPLLTMYVQPDHFLCLGDNSPESSDGRSWGAVPKRLLLGRALLVYYPFGRAGRIR
jgi:signal peptidase I